MTDKACSFCSEDIRASAFAETANLVAIYNIAPIVPGHTLIIPRRHLQRIADLSDDEFCQFWIFARTVTNFILDTFRTRAFDWTIQEQVEAGQTVPHLHLHIIPRVAKDFPEPGDWYPRLRHGRIVEHAREVIDSNDRVKLTIEQRKEIAAELATRWTKWNATSI